MMQVSHALEKLGKSDKSIEQELWHRQNLQYPEKFHPDNIA